MTLKRSQILIVVSLAVIGAMALLLIAKKLYSRPTELRIAVEHEAWALPDTVPNDAQNYQEVLARLEAERVALSSQYQLASSAPQQAAVMAQARTVLSRSIYTQIFPSWYGTAWDFNGTTEIPQRGSIACGYFVSTVLRDAGRRVQRVRLAQQASENIILSLTAEPYIKRFRKVAIADFVMAVKKWGTGIYIVGLDVHTGFIVNTGGEVYFIHSSYVEPRQVVREKAIESTILTSSNYRVIGRVTADDALIEKWLLKKEVVTR